MSNTIQKYKDYVMTGFLKLVAADRHRSCQRRYKSGTTMAANISIVFQAFRWSTPGTAILK